MGCRWPRPSRGCFSPAATRAGCPPSTSDSWQTNRSVATARRSAASFGVKDGEGEILPVAVALLAVALIVVRGVVVVDPAAFQAVGQQQCGVVESGAAAPDIVQLVATAYGGAASRSATAWTRACRRAWNARTNRSPVRCGRSANAHPRSSSVELMPMVVAAATSNQGSWTR